MSPRPRKVEDDAVFAATARVMTRLGPGELTLAQIAAEAGVTAAALSQRFGSKRQLLASVARDAAASAGEGLRALRLRSSSPLAGVRAYAASAAELGPSPAALARHLAYLQSDLSDPELRTPLVVQAQGTRAALTELLAEAVDQGELRAATDVPRLARTLELVLTGALLSWALEGEGKGKGAGADWFRAQADAVLTPYLARQRPAAASARAHRRSKPRG